MLLFVKSKRAFTAIELAVVIVLMAILAVAGSINSMKGYDTMKLDAAARKVASDIRYAQSLVLMNYNDANIIGTSVIFDPASVPIDLAHAGEPVPANTYRILNKNGSIDITVDFRTGEYQEVAISAIFMAGGSAISALRFAAVNPTNDSAPYLARPRLALPGVGGEELMDCGEIQLQYNSRTRWIHVEPETGLVQIVNDNPCAGGI